MEKEEIMTAEPEIEPSDHIETKKAVSKCIDGNAPGYVQIPAELKEIKFKKNPT